MNGIMNTISAVNAYNSGNPNINKASENFFDPDNWEHSAAGTYRPKSGNFDQIDIPPMDGGFDTSYQSFKRDTGIELDGGVNDYQIREYAGAMSGGNGIWTGSTTYSILDKRTGETSEIIVGKSLCFGVSPASGTGYSESALKELERGHFAKPGENVTEDTDDPKKSIVTLVSDALRLKSMNVSSLKSMQLSYSIKTDTPDRWLAMIRKAAAGYTRA